MPSDQGEGQRRLHILRCTLRPRADGTNAISTVLCSRTAAVRRPDRYTFLKRLLCHTHRDESRCRNTEGQHRPSSRGFCRAAFRVNRFAPVTNRFAHWRPELWSDSRKLQFLSETSWHAGCRFCCEAQGTGKKTQRIELNFMNALIPPSDSSVHGIRTSASISPPTFSRNGKILIVDDNEDARFLHSRVLSGAGYETDEAANGEEAWMMIFTTSYDLILTDYNMPHLNGLELVARMRASAMTVPVVLVSGALDLGRACDYPGLHLNAIVQKSFECGNVLDAVRRVLPTLLNETTPYSPKDALFRGHPAPTHPVLPQFN